MAKAIWKGKVIAQSDRTVEVEGNHYFSEESVDKQFLRKSATQSTCPWKGLASYYDVVVEGQVNKDAAWYYPKPKSGAQQVAGHVAFWKGVEITA